VATTVKSSPHAAWTIRLPTISPPMTQGPVRVLKSPTPSCPNLLDPTVIRRPNAAKKSNKMVYNIQQIYIYIISKYNISYRWRNSCKRFWLAIARFWIKLRKFVITKAFFRSNVFWEEKNRERRKNFSSLSWFHTISFVNSFNPGFNSALTLTVNYSWMRSPSRYRCDTVSEKQNTHIW